MGSNCNIKEFNTYASVLSYGYTNYYLRSGIERGGNYVHPSTNLPLFHKLTQEYKQAVEWLVPGPRSWVRAPLRISIHLSIKKHTRI